MCPFRREQGDGSVIWSWQPTLYKRVVEAVSDSWSTVKTTPRPITVVLAETSLQDYIDRVWVLNWYAGWLIRPSVHFTEPLSALPKCWPEVADRLRSHLVVVTHKNGKAQADSWKWLPVVIRPIKWGEKANFPSWPKLLGPTFRRFHKMVSAVWLSESTRIMQSARNSNLYKPAHEVFTNLLNS